MILNTLQPEAAATQPRGMVLVNGEQAAGLVSFEVDNNGYYQADTFRVTLALSAQPANRGFAFWAAQTSMKVELLAGYPANPDNFTKSDLKNWLTGWVDDIEVSPLQDEITITGRDMTAVLVDTKRSIAFTNMKSSEIAKKIAADQGLNAVVTETNGFAGAMKKIVKQLVNDRATYWDVLTKLAQFEGFDVYVTGDTLHFEPHTNFPDTYVLNYQPPGAVAYTVANFMDMRFARNLSVARGVKVKVLSWNAQTNKVVSAVAQRSRVKNATTAKAGANGLPVAEYTFTYPNMDTNQAQKQAQSLLKDISQHEVNLSAELVGDDLLTTRTKIEVRGTGTDFDQTYYPASIQRRYSLDDGYRMSVRARNYSPESQLS